MEILFWIISSFSFVTYDEFNKWSLVNKKFFGDDFVSPAWEYMKEVCWLTKNWRASVSSKLFYVHTPTAEFIKSWNKNWERYQTYLLFVREILFHG